MTVAALMTAMGGVGTGVAFAGPADEVTHAVSVVVGDVNTALEPTNEAEARWREYCRGLGGTPVSGGSCMGSGGVKIF